MHRAPVYDRLTGSTGVCIEQPFTQVMLGAPKYASEQPFFSAVLLASKKARINRLLTNAQSISEHRSMLEATVYSFMLEAPKYVRSNRLLRYARSSEVCSEQHFSLLCSVYRSMHGR